MAEKKGEAITLFDEDKELKKSAGSERLNQYSNYYEIQTLCEFLNVDYEKVLESDDAFCLKVLLCNLEKSIFDKKFSKLLQKRAEAKAKSKER